MSQNVGLINVNQFAPLPQVGMCLNPSHGQRIEAEYYPATATDKLMVCAPCKFVAGENPANNCIDIISSDAELPTAGVLIYDSSKRNIYEKHQYVTLARVGSIVLLKASAAITANDTVTIATNGTVAPSTAGKAVIGIAMNGAAIDGLVRVLFVEPYMVASSTPTPEPGDTDSDSDTDTDTDTNT